MAEQEQRWQRLIQGLRAGDRQVVQEFCDQYGALLHQLADKHLGEGLRRQVDPEDVVQSVCRTFLRRARDGEFQLEDSESLWRLLCAITLTKVREQTRFHLCQKRGLDQERPLSPLSGDDSGCGFAPVAPGPSPAEAVAFADQFQQVLAGFEEEERRLTELKLQEFTNDEVAERLGCSERTVRRILKRVQARLARALEIP